MRKFWKPRTFVCIIAYNKNPLKNDWQAIYRSVQSDKKTHPHQHTKSNNNNHLPVNHIPSKYKGQLPQDNSNFRKINQPRRHTMYVTIKWTSHKPNFPSTPTTHAQRTSSNPSPSEPLSQSEPNADSYSTTTTISHCSNQNSGHRSIIL